MIQLDVNFELGDLKFVWDIEKAKINKQKHGISFETAARVFHKPTGIMIFCTEERSQLQNKERALQILKAKLYDMEVQKQMQEVTDLRRSQVGTGDRSERIRTYNYHQGRVTDHRIGLTLYKLDSILAGDLDEIVDALTLAQAADNASSNEE